MIKEAVATIGAEVRRLTGRPYRVTWNENSFAFHANTPEEFAMTWKCLEGGTTSENIPLDLLVRGEDLLIDVGAHFGIYSVLLGKLNPKTPLICFEPSAENRGKLKQNLNLNSIDATIRQEVVVGESGTVTFFKTDRTEGHSTKPVEENVNPVEHSSVALSDVITGTDADSVFVKVDAEGEEGNILRDLSSLNVPVRALVEFHEDRLERSVEGWLDEFDKKGWDRQQISTKELDSGYQYPMYLMSLN